MAENIQARSRYLACGIEDLTMSPSIFIIMPPSLPNPHHDLVSSLTVLLLHFLPSMFHQSMICAKTRILKIITNRPIVTMINSAKLNQPITMALVPTPDSTLPLPKSWAMILAATEAVCCHNTLTKMNIEAMKMMAKAICDTGREGNGLTSLSLPSESSSSCHPGKVARRRRQMKARMIAMILHALSVICQQTPED